MRAIICAIKSGLFEMCFKMIGSFAHEHGNAEMVCFTRYSEGGIPKEDLSAVIHECSSKTCEDLLLVEGLY